MDDTSKEQPTVSIFVASAILLLYVPRPLLFLLFSPVPITTLLLLAALLLSASSESRHHQDLPRDTPKGSDHLSIVESHDHSSLLCGEVTDWVSRGSPLDVIYEGYEGQEEERESSPKYSRMGVYHHPESSDSDSSSEEEEEEEEEERRCFGWWEEEEEEGDGMIEIKLEDENFIEIDISGRRR